MVKNSGEGEDKVSTPLESSNELVAKVDATVQRRTADELDTDSDDDAEGDASVSSSSAPTFPSASGRSRSSSRSKLRFPTASLSHSHSPSGSPRREASHSPRFVQPGGEAQFPSAEGDMHVAAAVVKFASAALATAATAKEAPAPMQELKQTPKQTLTLRKPPPLAQTQFAPPRPTIPDLVLHYDRAVKQVRCEGEILFKSKLMGRLKKRHIQLRHNGDVYTLNSRTKKWTLHDKVRGALIHRVAFSSSCPLPLSLYFFFWCSRCLTASFLHSTFVMSLRPSQFTSESELVMNDDGHLEITSPGGVVSTTFGFRASRRTHHALLRPIPTCATLPFTDLSSRIPPPLCSK